MAVPPAYRANLACSTDQSLARSAALLVRAQRADAGWSWMNQKDASAPNTSGLVALALVRAHERTGDRAALTAAEAFGRAKLSDLVDWRPVYDGDVEALAALGRATDEPAYLEGARQAFMRRHQGASGREIVERLYLIRAAQPALVGFDAAGTLRAALAVGERQKALEIADAMVADARWLADDGKTGFLATSRGAMLEVLSALDFTRYAPAIASLREAVLASQAADGTWGTRNTQATAYSVRGLLATGGDPALRAAAKGVRFLRLTQLESGGWATFNDFLPEPFVGEQVHEVTAEVLVALSAARL